MRRLADLWRTLRRPVSDDGYVGYIGIDQHREERRAQLLEWQAHNVVSLRTPAAKGFAKRVQGGGEAA